MPLGGAEEFASIGAPHVAANGSWDVASARHAVYQTGAFSPQIARGIRRLDGESTGSMFEQSRETLRQLAAISPMAW
jgi:hypothetical protein